MTESIISNICRDIVQLRAFLGSVDLQTHVLYCIALYYAVQLCTERYCTMLQFTTLYRTLLHGVALYYYRIPMMAGMLLPKVSA